MLTMLVILFIVFGSLIALVVVSACALAGQCDDEQQACEQVDAPACPTVLRLDMKPAASE